MKYYKQNNEVFAYELDGSQDHLIGDKVAMTAEEIELHINPPKTLEQVKASKLQQIEDDYIALEEQTVEVSGVIYSGGMSSVEAIDGYVRLNRLAGSTTHNIWDVNGVEHILTDSQVDGVILAIGVQASANKFTKKNRKVALVVATTIAEVEVI